MTNAATNAALHLPEGSVTQTAYVVRDLEQHAIRWTRLTGAGPWFSLEPQLRDTVYRGQQTEARYRLSMAFVGASLIELIQPLDEHPSIFSEILNERGEGFHHVAPRLTGLSGASFDARCAELEQQGLEIAMTNTVVGLGRAAFYDAKESLHGFVEVFELGAGYSMVPRMAEIHHRWNGRDPLRSLESLFNQS